MIVEKKIIAMNVNEIKITLITLADARYSLHYFLIFFFLIVVNEGCCTQNKIVPSQTTKI